MEKQSSYVTNQNVIYVRTYGVLKCNYNTCTLLYWQSRLRTYIYLGKFQHTDLKWSKVIHKDIQSQSTFIEVKVGNYLLYTFSPPKII